MIDATIAILKDYGCQIVFGDGMTQAFLSPEGFGKVAAQLSPVTCRYGVTFAHFDEPAKERVPIDADGVVFRLPKWIDEIAGMVNLSVLKVHPQMVGTFAVKNHMGLLSGPDRLEMHRTGVAQGIWDLQASLGKVIPDEIHLVDGLISFQGYDAAPADLSPNILIGGLNPCAVDFVCAEVMGIDPQTQFPQYRIAMEQGFAYGMNLPVDVRGEAIADVRFQCHIPRQIMEPPATLPSVRIHWGRFDYPMNQSLKDLFRRMDCDLPIDIYVGGAFPEKLEKDRLCLCLGNASMSSCTRWGNRIVILPGDPPAGSIFSEAIGEIKARLIATDT